MVIKYEASCQKCNCIYLKNGDSALCLKTYFTKKGHRIKYNGETFDVEEFINEHINDLELAVIEFDHLTEEEQRERGLLGPNEKYIPKKNNVSELGSETAMRLEALKTQNVCMRCHLEETIFREAGQYASKYTYTERAKKAFVDEYKRNLGGCSICEYVNDDLLRFFHMDHFDPENKVKEISRMVKSPRYTLDDVKIELEKCRMLCAHCHAIHTRKQVESGIIQKKKINNRKGKEEC